MKKYTLDYFRILPTLGVLLPFALLIVAVNLGWELIGEPAFDNFHIGMYWYIPLAYLGIVGSFYNAFKLWTIQLNDTSVIVCDGDTTHTIDFQHIRRVSVVYSFSFKNPFWWRVEMIIYPKQQPEIIIPEPRLSFIRDLKKHCSRVEICHKGMRTYMVFTSILTIGGFLLGLAG